MNTALNTIISVIATAIASSAITALVAHFKMIKVLKNAMLSLLRAEIIRLHDKYTDRGYCPIYAKDALEKAYTAYHQLGGNGTITKLYNDTMALPEERKEI